MMNPHPQVLENLAKLNYPQAWRALKFWTTHGEQDRILRRVKFGVCAFTKLDPFNPLKLRRP